MKSKYWSIGSFSDWVRGTPKLASGTSQQWREWRTTASKQHPVRYWLAEEALDYLQNFVYYIPHRLNDIRYYINNRWVSCTHSLTAHPRDIKPGQWQDVGNRFLPCLFNELVDFVEIETAWHHVLWDEDEREKYAVPWYRRGWLRWRTWRCPQAGVAHLEWSAALTMGASYSLHPSHKDYNRPTPQALAAQEILDLYYWWTEEYPNRAEPHDVSGWSELCAQRRSNDPDDILGMDDRTKEQRAESQRVLKRLRKIESEYEKEEESMLIRLIKIRQSLWT